MKNTSLPFIAMLLFGCSLKEGPAAIARVGAKNGSNVSGSIIFEKYKDKIKMSATISGIGQGPVAIHIHEKGDCGSEDGASAGGHWNPTGSEHGRWGEEPFHSGDIGNIKTDQFGKGSMEFVDKEKRWTIGGSDTTNILGRAIIIHLGSDDMKSQPSGAAGSRIGCGVIQLKK
jgi:Cu-Zn family superoxide dismutase